LRSFEVPGCLPGDPYPFCRRIKAIRHSLVDPLDPAAPGQELGFTVIETPKVLLLTPTLNNPAAPSKAYISYSEGLNLAAVCPAGGPQGDLAVIEDLGAIPAAPVIRLHHSTPLYADLTPSPIPSDPRLFGIYACGMDIIDSSNDTIQEMAISGFGGDHLKAAQVGAGEYRLFALDSGSGLLTSYVLMRGTVPSQVTLASARSLDVPPDGKELVVLMSDSLVLLDSLSLQVNRVLLIGKPESTLVDLAVTSDGTRVLVTDSFFTALEVVRIRNAQLAQGTNGMTTTIALLADSAFVGGAGFRAEGSLSVSARRPNAFTGSGDRGQQGDETGDDEEENDDDNDDDDGSVRAKLLHELSKVAEDLEEAQEETDAKKRDKHLDKALKGLRKKIRRRMDGFFGGDPADDWIVDEGAQRLLYPQVTRLIQELLGKYSKPAGAPPVL